MSEKKISPAQQRALDKYKAKVNRFTVDFPPTDSELWEHLQTQPKKQTYIKALIRADTEKPAECDMCRDIQHIHIFDRQMDCFITDQMEYCPHCGRKIRKDND